ncbi:LacI family DNA-binding transcriptional regulator [Streptomyces shenzhenensis]|uniref:LacI family transcriptional regulator n=1 Tax=Streptomyces shenzhenensis TaxID=943815 RepID=A0A3M0IKN1_9ACTN|nr:LacI family DNA-binding transcriptional regulator [Streptomyces shenzhenensis]RMB82556.1 LacI family transcriptional regulator [Streptomyces shenzhenensis]
MAKEGAGRARPGRSPVPAGRRSRPRQAEVAQLAGVSQATVSLVLSGRDEATARPISEETRRKVLQAAQTLGYVPDPAARRLAAARNNLLGVFSFTATFPTDVRHSYYPFLVGVEQEAAVQGYDLVLFTGSSAGGADAAGAGALNRVRLADGCLFLGRHAPSPELARLVRDGFPVVHLGRREDTEGVAWVGADYISASRDVVTALAEAGHRRIVLVREDDDAPASTDREHGFLDGLRAAGLPAGPAAVFRTADPHTEVTAARVRAWHEDGVTAFVAEETDTGAAWRALRAAVDAAGLRCPGEVSLAVLGSPPPDLVNEPVPMGFDIPRARLGAEAVRLLSALIAGEPTESTLVACTFRAGVSSGPPATA